MLGWLKRRSSRSMTDVDAGRLVQNALDAVARLGDLMQTHPGAILDESRLPLPKPVMKTALLIAWKFADSGHARSAIEAAYVHLCRFQKGVGDTPIDSTLPKDCKPADVGSILGPYLAHADAMAAESKALLAEIQEFKRRMAGHRG
ncbi:MAG: hypothetical protein ACOY3L_14295 [Pseudomonadota bacterium]